MYYKLKIEYQISNHYLLSFDNLYTSGNLSYLIYEILLVLPHPNFASYGVEIYLTYQDEKQDNRYYYELDDFLIAFMLFRSFYILRFFLSISYYKSPRSQSICKLFGESNSFLFSFKSLFNNNPFKFILLYFVCSVLYYGYCIRIFERVLCDVNRNKNNPQDFLNFTPFENSIWCIIITMLTVGYGDYYPKTVLGKLFAVFSIFTGVTLVSLVTVAFFKYLSLSESEERVYDLSERLILKDKYKETCEEIVKKYISLWAYKSLKKRKEGILSNLMQDENLNYRNEIIFMKKQIINFGKIITKLTCTIEVLLRTKKDLKKNIDNIGTSLHWGALPDELDEIGKSLEEIKEKMKTYTESAGFHLKKSKKRVAQLRKIVD